MKNLATILILCLTSLSIYGQNVKTESVENRWEAPYNLPVPKDWRTEEFPFPLSFAPQIPYTGVEDIRFAPGFGNVNSEQYWTYAFLWYLDSLLQTDAQLIAENLKDYYAGLNNSNIDTSRIAPEKIIPVTASFKKKSTDKDDLETYAGTIKMIEFMQLKPIILNCIVHLKNCPEDNKAILFFELSPKPFSHNNWIELNQLWLDFKCRKS